METTQSHLIIPFLNGWRIFLGLLTRRDVEKLCLWINSPDTRHFLLQENPISLKTEEEWLEKSQAQDPHQLTLGIYLKGSEELIGVMSLNQIHFVHRHATTGAHIAKEYRHQGYGTEAKMILLEHAFCTLGLQKVCSEAIAFNDASLGFNANCGYHEIGRRESHHYKNGKWYDLVLTEVFRESWEPLFTAYCAERDVR